MLKSPSGLAVFSELNNLSGVFLFLHSLKVNSFKTGQSRKTVRLNELPPMWIYTDSTWIRVNTKWTSHLGMGCPCFSPRVMSALSWLRTMACPAKSRSVCSSFAWHCGYFQQWLECIFIIHFKSKHRAKPLNAFQPSTFPFLTSPLSTLALSKQAQSCAFLSLIRALLHNATNTPGLRLHIEKSNSLCSASLMAVTTQWHCFHIWIWECPVNFTEITGCISCSQSSLSIAQEPRRHL